MLYSGAEAHVYETAFFGRHILVKKRISKGYRQPALDNKLRKNRNKQEVRLLMALKKIGIPCPVVYYVGEDYFFMQKIDGSLLRDSLSHAKLTHLGKYIAIMHSNNIIHGDLTPANVISSDYDLTIIDFGLGGFSSEIEDKSIDLLLMKRSLAEGFDVLINSYILNYNNQNIAKSIVKHISEIEKRARYSQR